MNETIDSLDKLAQSYGLIVIVLMCGFVILLRGFVVLWRAFRNDSAERWQAVKNLTELVKEAIK